MSAMSGGCLLSDIVYYDVSYDSHITGSARQIVKHEKVTIRLLLGALLQCTLYSLFHAKVINQCP